jgi:hypothetical protein
MGAAVVDEELFDGGPPLGALKALGVVRPAKRHVGHRALATILVGWVPLVLLTFIQGSADADGTARSFLTDAAVHARFLIALPLLVLAEADAIYRFGHIACHFLFAGLVREKDHERYAQAVSSTRTLLDSPAAALTTLLLAYIVVSLLIYNVQFFGVPAWHLAESGATFGLSPAGLWHWLVSVPLLLVLFFGWVWRLSLWWRFLALMSRLDLRLVPAHPDCAAGLKFVSSSIRGYRLLAFAFAAIVAGTEMNRTLRSGAEAFAFRNGAIGVLIVVVVLAVGPLAVFLSKLRAAKLRGDLEYGALAHDVGLQFERRWLNKSPGLDPNTLETQEFSAMTDLYQVVANVYNVKSLPFALNDVTGIVVASVVPFVPVALMAVPLKDIVEGALKLLL